MARVLNFYMDDSGTRRPDRKPLAFDPQHDEWFALGGVLISEEDEADARRRYGDLCEKWGISYPLHSVEIRHKKGKFAWLAEDVSECGRFMRDLEATLTAMPVLGIACVIDRPGYDARYCAIYGRRRWQLCQTAFSIVVERAAKHAIRGGQNLRVLPEKCSADDDKRLRNYYDSLRTLAAPFDANRSRQYDPLTGAQLSDVLHEFRPKSKKSPMAQIADLYLWPMVQHGYMPTYQPYRRLAAKRRIVDAVLANSELAELGIKYSCFELVKEHLSRRIRKTGP